MGILNPLNSCRRFCRWITSQRAPERVVLRATIDCVRLPCELDFHEDGPSLFFHVVKQLSMETFSNAQAMCDKLSEFHPKHFKYDILQVNNYIQAAVKTLYAASSASGTITNQEILNFQFKIYKKIKPPAEWTSHVLLLEVIVASNPKTLCSMNHEQIYQFY